MTAGLFDSFQAGGTTVTLKNIFYATLGDLKFTNATSFQSYKETQNYNYVSDSTIAGRPTLQQVGGEMEQVSITVTFLANQQLAINPEGEYQKIKQEAERIRETGELATLVYGGRFYGEYVITKVSKSYEKTLPSQYGSKPIVLEANIELEKPENKPVGSNQARASE